MTTELHAAPTVDALIADPRKATALSSDMAMHLLCGIAGVLPALMAVAARPQRAVTDSVTPEKFLTVQDVVEQYHVTATWLYRHKRRLPHSQPSRKVLLFPAERLKRWFLSHQGVGR
jgi:hypothetical protein